MAERAASTAARTGTARSNSAAVDELREILTLKAGTDLICRGGAVAADWNAKATCGTIGDNITSAGADLARNWPGPLPY